MADSETVYTTQQVTSKTPEAREAHKKLLAEAEAIIANSRLKRDSRPKRDREAHKKLLAEANAFIANSRLKRAERHQHFRLISGDLLWAPPQAHPSRDSDGYPIAGQDEVDNAKQSSANAELNIIYSVNIRHGRFRNC